MTDRRRPRRPSKATRQVSLHLPPGVLAEVERLANGSSRNAVLVALIEEALRYEVEHQHASLLEAAVERTIRQSVAAHVGRLGDLIVRAVLDSDETRRLVLTLLVKEIGPDQTRMFRREAHSASWQRLKEPLAVPPEHHGTWPATPARS